MIKYVYKIYYGGMMENKYRIDIENIIRENDNVELLTLSFKDNLELIRQIISMHTNKKVSHITQKEAITLFDADTEQYTMFVNLEQFNSQNRFRFTLAHEYSHIVLQHFNEECVILFRDQKSSMYTKDKIEEDANDYAARLLIPTDSIKTLIQEKKNLMQMSKCFGVSINTMKARIERDPSFTLS